MSWLKNNYYRISYFCIAMFFQKASEHYFLTESKRDLLPEHALKHIHTLWFPAHSNEMQSTSAEFHMWNASLHACISLIYLMSEQINDENLSRKCIGEHEILSISAEATIFCIVARVLFDAL